MFAYVFSLDFFLQMVRQLPAVYEEWLLKDGSWIFLVDNVKGATLFF